MYQSEAMYNCPFFHSLPFLRIFCACFFLYHPGPCLGIRTERTMLVLLSSSIFSQKALCDPSDKAVWFYAE